MKSFTLTTRRAVAGACALLALGLAGAAQAAWPDKPVTLVVPYSAGGPTDVVARVLAVPMGQSLGQTVVVENTVGAGGTIARGSRGQGQERRLHHPHPPHGHGHGAGAVPQAALQPAQGL